MNDIATFLYANYPNAILPAAAAVNEYSDLAIYLLRKYSDDGQSRMHRFLNDPKIGMRAIPFVARFGDQGLDRLQENLGWLDKYFDADGKAKDKEWWTQIPGGAALDVARNWAHGHPNEWSELGWEPTGCCRWCAVNCEFRQLFVRDDSKRDADPGWKEDG